MLGLGRYSQWRSHFLRYLDTKSNGEYLRKCIFEGPYTASEVLIAAESEVVAENISTNEIYSYVDASHTQLRRSWTSQLEATQGVTLKHTRCIRPNYSGEFSQKYNTLALLAAASTIFRPSGIPAQRQRIAAKPVTPQSESVSEEDSDPEQARRDKDMKKNLALLAKYFKKLYKPTNNNLRTSSNSRNKTEDTTPRYNNDNQSRQFGNQKTMIVAGARETVGSPVVQQNGIQCFNCKGFGHYARECRKPKRVKDYAYHKEKMMMCKQAEQGVL
ncbi:integrase, catalytic region, zinc finger, CCHC-type containing protein [Tanacetum coccineum]